MKTIARLTALVVVVALSFAAVAPSHAVSAAAKPTAKNCFFVRNNLTCPCPRAEQARAVARAAQITAGALGTAIGTTASALGRTERKHGARKASPPTPPSKR